MIYNKFIKIHINNLYYKFINNNYIFKILFNLLNSKI